MANTGEVDSFVERRHRRGRRGAVPDDPGDEALARLLGELGCPLPLHQVRTLVLGALAGAEIPSLYRLRAALWDGDGVAAAGRGSARDALELLAGLRARLAVHRDGVPYRLAPVLPLRTAEDIFRYTRTRREEIAGFRRGLELVEAGPEDLTARARRALDGLDRVVSHLDRITRLVERSPSLSDDERREVLACLRDLDGILEGYLTVFQEETRGLRAERLARRPALRVLPGGLAGALAGARRDRG